jgi:hypothetical protein
MSSRPSEPPPIACTLGAGDFHERLAWIAQLNSGALRSHRRDDLQLVLVYAPEAGDNVRDLIRREQACCAFLTFTLRDTAESVELTIEAPGMAPDAADLVFAPFALKAGATRAGRGCTGAAA